MTKTTEERFREDLDVEYERLIQVVRNALDSTKKVWVEGGCKKCGCPHKFQVEVPNVRDSITAAEFLANRGIGRPGTVEPGERQVMHEYRLIWEAPQNGAPLPPDPDSA